MQAYNDTILTAQGNGLVPYANATVTVYLGGTTTLASLFSNNGTTVQINPFQASSLGVVKFYAVDGRYDIRITGTGFATVNLTDVLLEDFRTPATAASISTTVGGVTRTQQSKNNDVVNIKDFNPYADGVTDDYPSYLLAKAALGSRGGIIKFSAASYKINTMIDLDTVSIILDGDGCSDNRLTVGTNLIFPAGVAGIRMRSGTNSAGAYSFVKNMKIMGSDVGVGTNDGIRMQAHGCGIENVTVSGFGGNGIHVLSGVTPDPLINTNNFSIKNVRSNLNFLNGFLVEGVDSNVGSIENLDCSSNVQWGIYENSFLGNTYIAPHCATNGFGDYRFGNIARGNTIIGGYSEAGAPIGVQLDSGGASGNYLHFSQLSNSIVDNTVEKNSIILTRADTNNYFNFRRLGIGQGTLGYSTRFRVSGSDLVGLSQYGVYSDPVVANPCNNWATYTSYVSTAAATFTLAQLTHFQVGGIFSPGAGSSITTQTGFLVLNITGATTNIGYRGQVAAAANAWNLYMDGTAANYLQGAVTLGNGSAGAPSINWVGATTSGLHHYGTYGTAIDVGAFPYLGVNYNGSYSYVGIGSGIAFGWSAGTDITVSDALDTIMVRDGAGIIGQKNGANAQEYRVYGTTTGPKYLSLKHDGTNAIVSASSGFVSIPNNVSVGGTLTVTGPSTSPINVSQAGVGSIVFLDGYSGGAIATNHNLAFRAARGTIGSPTANQLNDRLGWFNFRGYGATAFASGSRGAITCNASENWTDTAQGTYIAFQTTAAGSTTQLDRVRIDETGTQVLGPLICSAQLNLASYTVATLPTGVQGDNAYVTNALAPTYGAAVAGGGAIVNRVFKNATQWVCA